MIDPELNYCPRCKDEYRADIEKCAACEVELISGRERLAQEEAREQRMAGRSFELTAEDDLVTIQAAALNDIKRYEELLTAEKIPTLAAGDEKSCGKGCCPSVFHLKVRREDAAEAMAILEEEYKRLTAVGSEMENDNDIVFNPHAREATCPACGETFPTATTTCPECGLCFG